MEPDYSSTCLGCGRTGLKGIYGLKAHQRQSKNPQCHAVLGENTQQPSSKRVDTPDPHQPGPAVSFCNFSQAVDELEPPAVSTMGDYFGSYTDYNAEDFGMDLDNEGEEQLCDSDEEEENTRDAVSGARLELPRDIPEPNSHRGVSIEEVEEDELGGDYPKAHLDSGTHNREAAEEPLRRKPFVIPFGGHAGAAVHGVQAAGENKRYGDSIGVPENIYAPFASRLDWEVAQWAKLRGPSSSSFTELMAIEGVSHIFFPLPLEHPLIFYCL